MGAGQSKGGIDEDIYIESGVRVTQGLLEQLEGKPRPQRVPPLAAGGGGAAAAAQALRPPALTGVDEAAAAAAAAVDRSVARATERSRRVGGMLLKSETEELGRVNQLAEELLSSEYVAQSRPRPCAEEAAACVRCYAEHAAEPLACAAAVEAYGACAKAAWREAVAREAL